MVRLMMVSRCLAVKPAISVMSNLALGNDLRHDTDRSLQQQRQHSQTKYKQCSKMFKRLQITDNYKLLNFQSFSIMETWVFSKRNNLKLYEKKYKQEFLALFFLSNTDTPFSALLFYLAF